MLGDQGEDNSNYRGVSKFVDKKGKIFVKLFDALIDINVEKSGEGEWRCNRITIEWRSMHLGVFFGRTGQEPLNAHVCVLFPRPSVRRPVIIRYAAVSGHFWQSSPWVWVYIGSSKKIPGNEKQIISSEGVDATMQGEKKKKERRPFATHFILNKEFSISLFLLT